MKYVFLALLLCTSAGAQQATTITVRPDRLHQEFQGLGCGAVFYEAHITSLAARQKHDLQKKLYDQMFSEVKTDYLHLFIRHDHEPANDNGDPWSCEFAAENFKYCEHTVAICEAARERNPGMQFYATLYTPPSWMKTNHDPSGGGKERGTLLKGMELELGEFIWGFLAHMQGKGVPMHYLSICNEPDWEHTQPSYFLTAEAHAALFAKVAAYLEKMHTLHPDVPLPKLVGPNILSAVDCAKNYLPKMLKDGAKYLDVVGCHDYDRRGNRWKELASAAKGRPVWCTEWCVNGKDESPGLIHSASEYWFVMNDAFNGGANVWMAYDWVYPPRQGGEALIHLNWGEDYQLTKIYHAFRQYSLPLEKGMKIAATEVSGPGASGISEPGVKAASFLSVDGKRLVIQVVCAQDATAKITLKVGGKFTNAPAVRHRTSATEDAAVLEPLSPTNGKLEDSLSARSMTTYELKLP